jgi:hypothetical protein
MAYPGAQQSTKASPRRMAYAMAEIEPQILDNNNARLMILYNLHARCAWRGPGGCISELYGLRCGRCMDPMYAMQHDAMRWGMDGYAFYAMR